MQAPKITKTEPAVTTNAIMGLVTAGVALGVAFGLDLSTEQQGAIFAFAAAALAVLGGVVIRSQVTPVAETEATGEPRYDDEWD